MEDNYTSIFVESSEDMGLMYNSYEGLLGKTETFLTKVEKCISDMNDKPTEVDIDLGSDIKEYKNAVNTKFHPSAINIRKIGAAISKVKKFQSSLDSLLTRFAKAKDKIAYGGNYYRAIIKRPKVYEKEINPEKYGKINKNIRNVNRAMDWIEKVIIDLFNLADQDMNILTIVDKVYAKQKIYESAELPSGIIDEDCADSIVPMMSQAMGEAPYVLNSRDKKNGSASTYLSRNHDMASWGEDDDDEKHKNDEEDKTLDDYKRPSAADDYPEYDGKTSASDSSESDDNESNHKDVPSGVQNYYYYTYNNSLNKNSHSFNKDQSSHDDHSSHHIDRRINDDHSKGKSIDSHNISGHHNTASYGMNDEDNDIPVPANGSKEDQKFHKLESSNPWELSLPMNEPFMEKKYEVMEEEVGDADDHRPTSDHPIKDTLQDVDRKLLKHQQNAKRHVQNAQNVGRAVMKPVNRTKDWLSNMVSNWKDADETNIKERLSEPHARSRLLGAIKTAIKYGALWRAGLLLNPIVLYFNITRRKGGPREQRIRNEMIGELKTEMEVIDEKIKDADLKGDNKAKYQLMRFKNEVNKKLMRVGGGEGWSKIL